MDTTLHGIGAALVYGRSWLLSPLGDPGSEVDRDAHRLDRIEATVKGLQSRKRLAGGHVVLNSKHLKAERWLSTRYSNSDEFRAARAKYPAPTSFGDRPEGLSASCRSEEAAGDHRDLITPRSLTTKVS